MANIIGFILIFCFVMIGILLEGGLMTCFDLFSLFFVVAGPICLLLVSFEVGEIMGAFGDIFKRKSSSEDAKMSSIIHKTLANYSMAFGAILGLIGYVTMLAHMEDPKEIPLMIAAILIGPLYGFFFGQFVYLPLATLIEKKVESR